MSSDLNVKVIDGSVEETYVVEGATLDCSLGTARNILKIPFDHRIYINGKRQANIADHIGGENILSFTNCYRANPPPACIMNTKNKWIKGKENVLVDGEKALLNTSVNVCKCGGIIRIVDNGQ